MKSSRRWVIPGNFPFSVAGTGNASLLILCKTHFKFPFFLIPTTFTPESTPHSSWIVVCLLRKTYFEWMWLENPTDGKTNLRTPEHRLTGCIRPNWYNLWFYWFAWVGSTPLYTLHWHNLQRLGGNRREILNFLTWRMETWSCHQL